MSIKIHATGAVCIICSIFSALFLRILILHIQQTAGQLCINVYDILIDIYLNILYIYTDNILID